MAIKPEDYKLRTFHYRDMRTDGAIFTDYHGRAAQVSGYVGQKPDNQDLVLCDLSFSARTGFKGRETLDWLSSLLSLEKKPNRSFIQSDGSICAVLSPGEAMLMSGFNGRGELAGLSRVDSLNSKYDLDSGVRSYRMPRQDSHFDFLVAGSQSANMFAKICGVDLRSESFSPGSIAQTSVALVNAIVVRVDCAQSPAYRLLADSASSLYMWQVLADAGKEFNLAAVGVADIRSLFYTQE